MALDDYKTEDLVSYTLSYSPQEPEGYLDNAKAFIESGLSKFLLYFDLPYSFRLRFVLFHSVDDFRLRHKRSMSPTALLVPHASATEGEIAFFSPGADKANLSKERMERHLLHELMHIWITIKTNSSRALGNGNKGLRIPLWLDEGLCEYVSLKLSDRNEKLLECVDLFEKSRSEYLFDFGAEAVGIDYKMATGRVIKMLKDSAQPQKDDIERMLVELGT